MHECSKTDVAPDSYPVALRVWRLPSCTVGAMGQGAEPSASAAPWPDCELFAKLCADLTDAADQIQSIIDQGPSLEQGLGKGTSVRTR